MARSDRDLQARPEWGGRLIHVVIVFATFALAVTAWWNLYTGLSSGCFKAKYGFICRVDRPTTFIIQMVLIAVAGLLYTSGCIITGIVLLDRLRRTY
jgi:di/tricarboxylate transporter